MNFVVEDLEEVEVKIPNVQKSSDWSWNVELEEAKELPVRLCRFHYFKLTLTRFIQKKKMRRSLRQKKLRKNSQRKVRRHNLPRKFESESHEKIQRREA